MYVAELFLLTNYKS